jgi:hypothetical protein
MTRKGRIELSERAKLYIERRMTLSTDEQQGNWTWGHMVRFVIEEIDRDRRIRKAKP